MNVTHWTVVGFLIGFAMAIGIERIVEKILEWSRRKREKE